MKKRTAVLLLALMMILSLLGCGGSTDEKEPPEETTPVEEPEPVPEPEPEPEPEPVDPAKINPLNGTEMSGEYRNLRPVAVMFNNLKEAQPQLGVSRADIIYEIPAEGGITRMLGVYQSMDGIGTLGSIRSARPYYLEAALGHDALLVHAGGSPDAYDKISAWDVDNMDGVRGGSDSQIFWRDQERRKTMDYEHTLVTSGENIQEYLAGGRYRTEHKDGYTYTQTFAEDGTPVNGTAAENFKLYFTSYKTGVFEYNAETRKYMISQYGSAYVDGGSGDQVSATNVLVLETDISTIPGDKEGRLTVRMTGSGEGTYFCGGKCIPINWSKADRNSQFVYTLTDGTPLTMETGNVYVCISDPDTARIEIQ